MKSWGNDISEEIREFHDKVVSFACFIQEDADRKHADSKSNQISGGAFYKLHAQGVGLHRSILSLCDNGWAQTTPILLRVMLDVLANLLVIGEKDFEYRAFKYFYYSHMKAINSQDFSNEERLKFQREMEEGLNKLDTTTRERIMKFINAKKFGVYWFRPEYKSPSKIFSKLTKRSSDLVFVYRAYSGSSHGAHVGSSIYLDEPDKIDINPRSNPEKAKLAVLHSCRCLLDMCLLRSKFEKLGLSEIYLGLLKELNVLGRIIYIPK